MIRLDFLLILTMVTSETNGKIQIGFIYNATYDSTSITAAITYKDTCMECICYAFSSRLPPLYVGLNCYNNNKTCVLFANYSSTSTVKSNINSTFIFIKQPPLQNTTSVLPLLIGVTVAGYGNGTSGSANNALNFPWGIALGVDGSIFVSDYNNYRVMKIEERNRTASLVAGTGVLGNNATQLRNPTGLAVDAAMNLYVSDNKNYRVMLWGKNSSFGVKVVATGVNGNATNTISNSGGVVLDSQGNIYVDDLGNHRVMKWSKNATQGTLVAGTTGVAGSNNSMLDKPYQLYLDENSSYIYITDLNNHRVQRYKLGVSANGTTVAGGNGQGSGSNQLNSPNGVYVSKKTGDIYIADGGNHRIQRWSVGATSGVTVAGVTGVNGTNATLLSGPSGILLSMNETFLYVCDSNNNRVQRFQLP